MCITFSCLMSFSLNSKFVSEPCYIICLSMRRRERYVYNLRHVHELLSIQHSLATANI